VCLRMTAANALASLPLALCAVSYALKAAGPLLAGGRELGPQARRALDLVSVPLLAALILVQTVGAAHDVVVDARMPALAVAAVLVWRRAPFLVVVLAAAGTAALLRVPLG
jgi:branched-subunit amino acid transport protein